MMRLARCVLFKFKRHSYHTMRGKQFLAILDLPCCLETLKPRYTWDKHFKRSGNYLRVLITKFNHVGNPSSFGHSSVCETAPPPHSLFLFYFFWIARTQNVQWLKLHRSGTIYKSKLPVLSHCWEIYKSFLRCFDSAVTGKCSWA